MFFKKIKLVDGSILRDFTDEIKLYKIIKSHINSIIQYNQDSTITFKKGMMTIIDNNSNDSNSKSSTHIQEVYMNKFNGDKLVNIYTLRYELYTSIENDMTKYHFIVKLLEYEAKSNGELNDSTHQQRKLIRTLYDKNILFLDYSSIYIDMIIPRI